MPDATRNDVLVAIPTFKRPALLAALLASLEGQVDGCRVLVIDNDPARSAEPVAAASAIAIDYVSHPVPGLAQVRNRALDSIDGESFLVFIDDDETADDGWLDALVTHARTSRSAVVTGPVISELPTDAPRWIRRGGFIQRDRFATGDTIWTAASNNTALNVAAWRQLGSPRFDAAFSATGGEDTDFFARLVAAGAHIEWCDEAVVREPVAADRLTLRWITRRAYSAGLVVGVLRRRDQPAARIAASSFAATAVGAVQMLAEIVTLRGVQTKSFERTLGGIGRIASLFGATATSYPG